MVWLIFMSFGFVEIGEDLTDENIESIGNIPKQNKRGDKAIQEYCTKKIESLLEDYKIGFKRKEFLMLTDNQHSVPIKYLKKFFKIVEFTKDEKGMEGFKASDVFWFHNVRLPMNTTSPCSLLFQNSLEGYEELHLKNRFARLSSSLQETSDLVPKSWDLDNPIDCQKFFSLSSNEVVEDSPKYVLKGEERGTHLSHSRC